MAKTMTASEAKVMTDGQIEAAVNQFRDAMRKHRFEITSEIAQQVLGVENLGMEMFAPFRRHAEVISNLIVRRVKVDRSRTPQAAIEATGRNQYVDDCLVETMPRGEGEEVDVYFFKLNRFISDDDLEKEYDLQGLVPADPYSTAAVNEDDPSFADDYPNATHWKDPNGKWRYAAFVRWSDARYVSVDCYVFDWPALWWFAGLRK